MLFNALHEFCKTHFSPECCSLAYCLLSIVYCICYLYVFSYIFCVFMCTPMNFSHRSASSGSDGFVIIVYTIHKRHFDAWNISIIMNFVSEREYYVQNEWKQNDGNEKQVVIQTNQQPTEHKSARVNAAVCARVYLIHSVLLNNNNNYNYYHLPSTWLTETDSDAVMYLCQCGNIVCRMSLRWWEYLSYIHFTLYTVHVLWEWE